MFVVVRVILRSKNLFDKTHTQFYTHVMTTAGFEKAMLLQNMPMFKKCLDMGHDHSEQDFFNRTPMFGLRYCSNASVEEFVDVLSAFLDAGADINHIDCFGNTLLLLSEIDNLGVALVQVGACVNYEWGDLSKRGLANAASYGCTRTIDAIVATRLDLPNQVQPKEFDSSLDRAAKAMSYNPGLDDMTGIVKLIVDYGANPNKWSTLHYSVRKNHVLVSTLVSLGARVDSLAWDFYRGVKNTPLHRTPDMITVDVLEALQSTEFDINSRDASGSTPLMALMKVGSKLHSEEDIMTRFIWLTERGASCLPVDNKGKRVSAMIRSKASPFKEMIAARIKDENWLKRRGMVLWRRRLRRSRSRTRRGRRRNSVVFNVVALHIDGLFRHIVTYL